MTWQNARKYVLPMAVVLALAFLAVWAFQQRPAAALPTGASIGDGASANPVGQVTEYPSDVVLAIGVGQATGVPDLARLSLGVEVTADTVAEARNGAAESMQNVMDALTENGIAAADIKTRRFRIHPEYDYGEAGREQIGYTASNSVNVTVRNTDNVAAVIDATIAAGGDDIVFNGLNFSMSDTAAIEREARQAAVENMQEKAAQMATFAGRELGELKLISESGFGGFGGVAGEFALAAASFDRGTPISVGEDEITVIVYGVYELQ